MRWNDGLTLKCVNFTWIRRIIYSLCHVICVCALRCLCTAGTHIISWHEKSLAIDILYVPEIYVRRVSKSTTTPRVFGFSAAIRESILCRYLRKLIHFCGFGHDKKREARNVHIVETVERTRLHQSNRMRYWLRLYCSYYSCSCGHLHSLSPRTTFASTKVFNGSSERWKFLSEICFRDFQIKIQLN